MQVEAKQKRDILYSAAHGFSRHTAEFAVCHGICCLPWKNAELLIFATFTSNSRFFGLFYLNKKQLGSLLVDLAHQLSFYLDSPVVQFMYKFANSLPIGC